MEYVSWTIFIWVVGIVSILIGIIWKYIKDETGGQNKKLEDLNDKVEKIEDYHTQTKIEIVKIQKDIEYIKTTQNKTITLLEDIKKR